MEVAPVYLPLAGEGIMRGFVSQELHSILKYFSHRYRKAEGNEEKEDERNNLLISTGSSPMPCN